MKEKPFRAKRLGRGRQPFAKAIDIYRKPLTIHCFTHCRFLNAAAGTRRCSPDALSLAVFPGTSAVPPLRDEDGSTTRKCNLESREIPAPASIVSRLRCMQVTGWRDRF